MPNYCDNIVTFEHKDPAMLEHAKDCFKKERLLRELVPSPIDMHDPGKIVGWRVQHWGTKWDVRVKGCQVGNSACGVLEEGPCFFRCSFLTAWGPPIGAYDALRDLGFEIEASYLELGMYFSGVYRFGHAYSDGVVPPDMLRAFGYDDEHEDAECIEPPQTPDMAEQGSPLGLHGNIGPLDH